MRVGEDDPLTLRYPEDRTARRRARPGARLSSKVAGALRARYGPEDARLDRARLGEDRVSRERVSDDFAVASDQFAP
jgi:hypothetical protein